MLTFLFNASMSLQHVSKCLKAAEMIMIENSGKPPTAKELYRAIFLLSAIAKLLDKILLERIKAHVDVPNFQFDFIRPTAEQIH